MFVEDEEMEKKKLDNKCKNKIEISFFRFDSNLDMVGVQRSRYDKRWHNWLALFDFVRISYPPRAFLSWFPFRIWFKSSR